MVLVARSDGDRSWRWLKLIADPIEKKIVEMLEHYFQFSPQEGLVALVLQQV